MQKRLPLQQPQLKAMIYFIIFTTSSPYTTPRDEPQSQHMWMVPISSTWFTVPLSPVVRLVYGSSIRTSSTLVPDGYFSRSMITYSIIMFLTATPFGVIGVAIYRGKTNLIHDYHQTNVTHKSAYGKSFGKAMFVISTALLFSGTISLLGDSEKVTSIAVIVLIVGLIIGFICIFCVQKKYNNGVF